MTIDDGSCFYALCLPVELTIEENCIWDSFSGEFITRVIITPTITGVCYLEEICYQEVGGGIQGCMDLPATGQFIQSGESVIIPLLGAGVYEFTASTSQGTSDPVDVAVNCYDNQSVCGNPYAVNYDPDAEKSYELACIYDNYICDFESCLGCTDPEACNFASTATQDDGSCDFESCLGCPDHTACNYVIGATQNDGSLRMCEPNY